MSIKDKETFAILLETADKFLADTVSKISLKEHTSFNRVNLSDNNLSTFIMYDIDKNYMFDVGANKKLKFIWKDADNFYIIDFSKNTKGDIINYLTFEETTKARIEGNIVILNIKKEFNNLKKVPLINSKVLDNDEPILNEHFIIYIK